MTRKVEHKVTFHSTGERARCAPDPRYPIGIDTDLTNGATITCTIRVQYPAQCIGIHLIECVTCGMRVAVTAAGRPDDPREVRIACRGPLASG